METNNEDSLSHFGPIGPDSTTSPSVGPSEPDSKANDVPAADTEAFSTPYCIGVTYYAPDDYPFYATFAAEASDTDTPADDNEQQFNVEQQFHEQFQREQRKQLFRLSEGWSRRDLPPQRDPEREQRGE